MRSHLVPGPVYEPNAMLFWVLCVMLACVLAGVTVRTVFALKSWWLDVALAAVSAAMFVCFLR